MAEKVKVAGVRREAGWLYFIDSNGNVARSIMARGRKGDPSSTQVVTFSYVRKEPGYLYFLDKEGDVSRAKMGRVAR